MRSGLTLVGGLFLVVLLAAQVAFAQAADGSMDHRIPYPQDLRDLRLVKRGAEDVRIDTFAHEWGGHWWGKWNRFTGTAHHFHGTGIELTGGQPLTAESAERVALEFVAQHPEIFGARVDDLRLVDVVFGHGKCSVLLNQYDEGLEVLGARIHLVFTETGRLYAFGSDFYPEIDLRGRVDRGPEWAIGVTGRELGFNESSDEVLGCEPIIFPILSEDGYDFRLCYRTELKTEVPMGIWVSFVDAGSGEILWRYNRMSLVNVVGNVSGDVDFPSRCDAELPLAFPHLYVSVQGGNQGVTDADGDFDISHPGSDPVTVEADLEGLYAHVIVVGGGDAHYSGIATPGEPHQIYWNNDYSQALERPAYWHTNAIHDWIKGMDPTWTAMDYQMPVYVKEVVSPCPANAWYDGYATHYCKKVGGFAHTSRSATIIYHEYTHGITDQIYIHGPPTDVNEGNSDTGGCILSGDSRMGNGWMQYDCDSNIRNCEHEMQYPDDLTGEPYHDGRILAGFYWHAFNNLWGTYGKETAREILGYDWHFARRSHRPQNFPDQVYWTFVEDDDDGNLDNGTPHYEELCAAAQRHGFDCPEILHEVTITHERLSPTTDEESGYPVTAEIASTDAGLDPDALLLYYSVNGGGFDTLPLEGLKNPGLYGAEIPVQDPCSVIDYYLSAEDSVGNTKTSPTSVPYNYHTFGVGVTADSLEWDSGWTVGVPGDSATTGIWVRVDPTGTLAQPEDDHTTGTGTRCYVTGDTTAGEPVGTSDVDGGSTTLLTPVYDMSCSRDAAAVFSYWFSNNAGANPWDDCFEVHVSNDSGSTWTPVFESNVTTYGWVTYTVNLDSLQSVFGPLDQVQFKFAASDTGEGSIVEAAVDDFVLCACAGTAVEDGDFARPKHGFWLAANRPNPFNPMTAIEYSIPKQEGVSLRVYNAQGQLVRTLVDQVQAPGRYAIGWDGTDGKGRTVASGVYFYRLTSGERSETRKMILLK